jgi:hypothetical protein
MNKVLTLIIAMFMWLPSMSTAETPQSDLIQSVITKQLAAFLNDDAAAAWSHAHPSIKAQFNSAEDFMSMVSRGYKPMTNFTQLAFLSLKNIEDVWVQKVRLMDTNGDRFEILYLLMESEPSVFQISGVSLEQNSGI